MLGRTTTRAARRAVRYVIVRDAYQEGRYRFTGADLCRAREKVGFVTKGDLDLVPGRARLRPYGYPRGFVPNIVHQHILVLRAECQPRFIHPSRWRARQRLRSRSRTPWVGAASIAVQASAIAPSRIAWSAAGVRGRGGELGLVVDGRRGVDADDRVDRRHGVRDVAHVGREARHQQRSGQWHLATDVDELASQRPRHWRGRAASDRRRGSCRRRPMLLHLQGSAPLAKAPASKQRITFSRSSSRRATVAARIIQWPSVRAGMMFGASPPTDTMPWTRSVGSNRLAEQPDGDLGHDQRVGGVDASLGKRAGVRWHTRVGHVDRLRGQDLGQQLVVRPGMDHQRRSARLRTHPRPGGAACRRHPLPPECRSR